MTVDMSQFYQTFFEESFEGLDTMEAGLLNLHDGAADPETINTIFRAAHSIKGGAGTFGFDAISNFTHVMETLLDQVRNGERMVSTEMVDLFLKSVDCLRHMMNATQDGTEIDAANVATVQQELEVMLHGHATGTADQAPASDSDHTAAAIEGWEIHFQPHEHLMRTGNDPVRLLRELRMLGELEVEFDDAKLPAFSNIEPENSYLSWRLRLLGDVPREQIDEVFEWVIDDCDLEITPIGGQPSTEPVQPAETPIPAAPTDTPQAAAAPAVKSSTDRKKVASSGEGGSIRVSTDKIDALINMVGELVITQSMLGQWSDEDSIEMDDVEKLRDGLAQLERNTRELQESVMRIRMLPISFTFQRFPRMVRDLAQKLDKEVELKLSGEQTELDKTVMEKIGDPLVHLVRNSMDHGLETPDVREAAGKSRTGTVHLNAYHQGGNIVIEISDDGAGLNKEKIVGIARERGIVGPDEQVSDERVGELIFEPGFSTAEEISDVSGRGVGMDVVKKNIRELGGNIEVRTKEGEGSTFTIRLPLTLAILDGQLVRVGDDTYIIPLVSIIESLQVYPEQLSAIAGKAELYKLRDNYMPVMRLHEAFNVRADNYDLTDGLLVVVEGDGQRAGLFVDELLGQQQVVIKSLETNFKKVEGVSGATILGDGTVALILDVGGLVNMSNDPELAHRRSKRILSSSAKDKKDEREAAA